jgi:hypothetical protein
VPQAPVEAVGFRAEQQSDEPSDAEPSPSQPGPGPGFSRPPGAGPGGYVTGI